MKLADSRVGLESGSNILGYSVGSIVGNEAFHSTKLTPIALVCSVVGVTVGIEVGADDNSVGIMLGAVGMSVGILVGTEVDSADGSDVVGSTGSTPEGGRVVGKDVGLKVGIAVG